MIISSQFSQSSLLISNPNQPFKSSFTLQQNHYFLPISSARRRFASSKVKMASSLTSSGLTKNSSSFYEVLGIPMGAAINEIKAAYRKLARVCHPDVAKDAPADEFIRIHAAYSTLSDPEKRADYDHRILRSDRRFTHLRNAPSGRPGPVQSRRKWETDQCW